MSDNAQRWRGLKTAVRRILALSLIFCSFAAAWVWLEYPRFAAAPLHVAQPLLIDIPGAASTRHIILLLRDRGIVRGAEPFYLYIMAWRKGQLGQLQSGEYRITPGTLPEALLDKFAKGQVFQHAITFVEGWRIEQLLDALAHAEHLKHTLPENAITELPTLFALPVAVAEGQFFPDTYFYTNGMSDRVLLGRAARRMREILAEEWAQRMADLPLQSPQDALILASIVEKETARADERAVIAGVLVRRLRLGMPLQVDPTVIYGLGSAYQGDLKRHHLRSDTPYNTYTRHGLPPGPIAAPGRAALHAALHPADGDALYYVARSDGSGGHVFSATLEAHEHAVDQYQRHLPGLQPSVRVQH